MKEHPLLALLLHAFNHRDIDALLQCFSNEYDSVQPIHPGREFKGTAQVRENWSGIFNDIPDFSARVVNQLANESTLWAEWEWNGTRKNQTNLHMRGVTIFGTKNNKVIWARLFMEPVEERIEGIQEAVQSMRGTIGEENIITNH